MTNYKSDKVKIFGVHRAEIDTNKKHAQMGAQHPRSSVKLNGIS